MPQTSVVKRNERRRDRLIERERAVWSCRCRDQSDPSAVAALTWWVC